MTDKLVDILSTRRFVRDLLTAHGADGEEADVVAGALMWSDLRGQPGQGICRIPVLVERLLAGGIVSPCPVEFHSISRSAECLDGKGGFGHYVASLAVLRAAELGRNEGVSLVTVRNSNHFGAAGYYAHCAAQNGFAALVTSNAFPTVAAVGGRRPVLGTNPLAFAAPRENGEPLIIDMGTSFGSKTAFLQRAAHDGIVFDGAAIDSAGNPATDVNQVDGGGALLPPDAKSYALGIVVEILSGILTGAEYSNSLRSFYRDPGKPAGLGHAFICIDVDAFMPIDRFRRRLEHLVALLAASGDMDPGSPIRIPGERRWAVYRENTTSKTVPLSAETISALDHLAWRVGMLPPWSNSVRRQSPHRPAAPT